MHTELFNHGSFTIAEFDGGLFQIFALYNGRVQAVLQEPLMSLEAAKKAIDTKFSSCSVEVFRKRINQAFREHYPAPFQLPEIADIPLTPLPAPDCLLSHLPSFSLPRTKALNLSS